MSKLYLALDEQGYVIGMGDNPDVYPRCIEAPEWFDPGQHFKTGRVVGGALVVDLDGMKAAVKARIKETAAKLISALDWKLERAREREAAGWATLAEVDAVLAEREAIRRASNRCEADVEAALDVQAVQAVQFAVTEADRAIPQRLTRLQFLSRFTEAEMTAILAAADQSPALKAALLKWQTAEGIVLTDPATIAGVQALEIAGLIGGGRAAEILSA